MKCNLHKRTRTPWGLVPGILISSLCLAACTPTVKVATEDPITINLNVNIKHEILVKVDKDLEDVFSEDSGLF
jgi:hypothetical protein